MSRLPKGFSSPSIASTSQEGQMEVKKNTLFVSLLSSEWRSSTSGDTSTINRELAIQLAKHSNVQVSVFLPQCSEEDKDIAASHKVQLIEAERITGMDPVDWLISVPENHAMDCIIGHGTLGRHIPLIQRSHDCKWIQVVHSVHEELGMYKSNADAISRGEKLQQTEIELCERADQVVAVGPKLADAYKRYLRSAKNHQNVLDLTPSIFTEFLDVEQATEERKTFCVLVIGSGDSEDFNLKGYDLAAQAIAELKEKSYQLRFICAPGGKGGEIAAKLLKHGITRDQLIVRSFNESREILARLFCEVDLAIMPSRTEGFGLAALEALSAGLPVLVSGNSGLGEALKKVPTGSNCVVDSDDPKDWAKEIRAVRQKDREVRLAESKHLREKYLERYRWQEPCGILVEKMQNLVFVECSQLPFPAAMQQYGEPPYLKSHHPQSSPGWLPSSVEYSQFPSAVASQAHEGPSYQRRNTQSSSGHGRPPSSVEYHQLPFTAATHTLTQTYQTSHTQKPSPVDSFDVKTCQRKLMEHYRKTAKVPTTVWSSVIQVDLDKIYTRLSWVKEEQNPAGSSQKKLSHYTELFTEKTKSRAVPMRILVQGETGIGKTTFVKKLLVDWSRNLEEAKMDEERKGALRKFELVVSINLKQVSKCQTLREIISCSRLFPEDEEQSVDDVLSYIRKNQEKVLVVFDGYDEYRTGSEAEKTYGSRSNSPIYDIFHGNILRDCTVLVTTRSSRADEIRAPADIQAEITGFNMSDRKDFIRKMLDDQTQVDGLLNFLRKSNMEDLARLPLLALFFCLLWKEEKEKLMELTESKTKLFQAIMKHILQHSRRKHSPQISKLKEADYEEILSEIGKVALAGLLKGDLMFEYGQLPEKVRGKESIIVGLLQLSEYGPSLEPMEMVSFIHKSIQEYLAAWYITYRCVPEGSLGGIEQHARTLEDCEALENVFQFICGLSDEGAVKVFQHLSSVRISDPTLDLSKIIPDVENETDVPLCDVTDRHERFHYLIFDSFREVRSMADLLTHCFDCTGGIVLITRDRPLNEILPKVNIPAKLAQNCFFLFTFISFDDGGEDSVMYKTLEFLTCLQMPLTLPDSSTVLTDEDVVRKFRKFISLPCFFSSILCFRNGQFQFYITELFLQCDDHVILFTESSTDSSPSVAASMFSEQSCLKFLSSLRFYNLSGQSVKALGAVIQNCKHLKRIEAQKSDDSVCDLLKQVPNPSKCSLTIGSSDLRPDVSVHLTSAGVVQLANLLPRFNNTIILSLDLNDCCSQAVNTLVTGITHETLVRLVLSGISLTSAAAAALGGSLPEMSSLQVLELTGVDGSTLQAEDMEKLFGGFNKTLPLYKLTFNGFGVRGCLTPLTKSFRFFPSLKDLKLEKLNLDEHDQCGLLESFRFIRDLTGLNIREKQQGDAHCYTEESNTPRVGGKLNLDGISLTPEAAAALGRSFPEMSSLLELELTGVDGSTVQAEDIEKLFGGLHTKLPLCKLVFGGFSVRGCLAPLIKSLCFFPNLRELKIEKLHMNKHDQCGLLQSLRYISKITQLRVESRPLNDVDCCTAQLTLTSDGFADRHYKSLKLDGINLTPTAAALGRSLPEMSSLNSLELVARDGSILQAVELDALFGGFNETLPLYGLTFRGFSVEGSIASLTNSFHFFPKLRGLYLSGFNVDEHNLFCLLESLRFIPYITELTVCGKPLSYLHSSTTKVNIVGEFTHRALKELVLSGVSLTPAAASALGRLLPEMLALEELTLAGVRGSILEAEELEALFGGFNKSLPLHKLTFSGFSVRGCLAPLTRSFPFLPNLKVLNLGGFYGEFNMDEHNLFGLLESLRFIPNLKTLSVKGKPLSQAHSCTAHVNAKARITPHKTLEHLSLDGISLTPVVAAALGWLLPEMSSLQELQLTGVDGSPVQVKEMEVLCGGFNNALPLYKLIFRDFSVEASLAPLIKTFRFFPNLRELQIEKSRMDEHDQCHLLENLRFFPNLRALSVRAEDKGPARCYTTDSHVGSSFSPGTHDKLNVDGISLTPTVAAALGRSLPMSSLQELEVTGVDGSILQGEDMVALFGGINKRMPLTKLTFSGFNVAGCLAPLNKTLCYFPNLRELRLDRLKLDEHDQCGLLENFGFICNLTTMNVRGKHRDSFSFHYYTRESNTAFNLTHNLVEEILDLDGISLTPAVAAMLGQLLPKMSSLNTLEVTGVDGSNLQAEEMKALFGGLNKTLPLNELTFSRFSVRGCLAPFTNMLHFFPNLIVLNLLKVNIDEHDLCGLLNSYCCTAEVNTTANFSLKSLEKLSLDEINLTPTAAAALGRSLPEMTSLLELKLTGVGGSIFTTQEMEALFGGFNETFPLSELTFSGFSVTGCLAPLTKSLRFFPNLTYLYLEKLNLDEHDLCGLLKSFHFIPDLKELDLSFNPLGHAVRSIVPHVSNLQKLRSLRIHQTDHSEEDFNYVRDAIQQALPELKIYGGTTDFSQCHTM